VEMAGVEPASEKFPQKVSTSLVPEGTNFFGLFAFVNILKPSTFTAFHLVYAHPTRIEDRLVNSSLKTFLGVGYVKSWFISFYFLILIKT